MPTEDEIARAARRSAEWKARQAELAEARLEDAAYETRLRAIKDAERAQNPAENVWRNVILILFAAVFGLLFLEQQSIGARADTCLGGAARPGHYRCADPIVASPWFWMLSRQTRSMLLASQSQR